MVNLALLWILVQQKKNRKCQKYYTKEDDGLQQDWGGHTVFCNPPYGKKIGDWVRKCYEESKKENTIVVLLIPARTDTAYFHDYIYGRSEIHFLRGRLKFGNSKNSAPFPSMIVVFVVFLRKKTLVFKENFENVL